MIDLDRLHTRPCLFAAFATSVALGGIASIRDHCVASVEAARLSPQAIPVSVSVDPAAESVRAMPEYKRFCAARACGHCAEARAILARLAESPGLNAAERAYCRKALRTAGAPAG